MSGVWDSTRAPSGSSGRGDMTGRAWVTNWRWWHVVSLGMAIVWPIVSLPMITSLRRVGWGAMAPIALLGPMLLWLAVISPWLDSGDGRFSESVPPRTRRRSLRAAAWGPCAIACVAPLMLLIDAGINWVLTRQWEPYGLLSPWWLLPIAPLALHAWWFDQLLQQRLREAVARADVCTNCAYSFQGLSHFERCPECGQAVESSVVSTRSGDPADAVARD